MSSPQDALAAAESASTAGPQITDAEVEAPSEVPLAATAPPAEAEEEPFDGETHYILQEDYDFLISMGFSENAIKKSVASGCINTDTCTQWITMHKDHPELDTPLASDVRVIVKIKKILTDEERAQKVLELKEKAKQIKEREKLEEAARQQKQEKDRIQMGKGMLEMKELREAQARANVFAERQKEKEADAMAREKIRLQLAVDKLVRQGMTVEAATKQAAMENEEAKKRQREEADVALQKLRAGPQAAESDSNDNNNGRPKVEAKAWNLSGVLGRESEAESLIDTVFNRWTPPPPIYDSFVELAKGANASARSTLVTILSGVIAEPLNNKKRILRSAGAAFSRTVGANKSALEILRTVGFDSTADEQGTELLVMHTVVLRYLHRAVSALDTPSTSQ